MSRKKGKISDAQIQIDFEQRQQAPKQGKSTSNISAVLSFEQYRALSVKNARKEIIEKILTRIDK